MQTPLLAMIGGLSGGRQTSNFEFPTAKFQQIFLRHHIAKQALQNLFHFLNHLLSAKYPLPIAGRQAEGNSLESIKIKQRAQRAAKESNVI